MFQIEYENVIRLFRMFFYDLVRNKCMNVFDWHWEFKHVEKSTAKRNIYYRSFIIWYF